MFEAQAAYYLNKYLGKYVDGVDPKSLRISVWEGDVVLQNLRVRPEALEELNLPITVKAGLLGTLRLKVPWNKLGKEPVVVEIDKLYVLAGPFEEHGSFRSDEELDAWVKLVEDRENASKRHRVQEMELEWIQKKDGKVGDIGKEEQSGGYFQYYIETILGNFELKITNVHIRYEDGQSNPGSPFAIGLTFKELSAHTVDKDGKRAFVNAKEMEVIRKYVKLGRLAVYFDATSTFFAPKQNWSKLSQSDWDSHFLSWINKDLDEKPCKYFLRPVDGALTYLKRRQIDGRKIPENEARQEVHMQLKDISAHVSRKQYEHVQYMLTIVNLYQLSLPYRHLRPPCRPVNPRSRRMWWHYAHKCVRLGVLGFSSPVLDFMKMCKIRRKYVPLYVECLEAGKVGGNEKIEEMDNSLEEATILVFRHLAHIRVEQSARRQALETAANRKPTWSEWFWGTRPEENPSIASDDKMETANLSEEQWNHLNSLMGVEDDGESAETAWTLKHQFSAQVGRSALTITDENDEWILYGDCTNTVAVNKIYPSTSSIEFSLVTGRMICPAGTIISSVPVDKSEISGNESPVLQVNYISNPQHQRVSTVVNVKCGCTFITCYTAAVQSLSSFLKPVAKADFSILEAQAAAGIRRAKKRAEEQLMEILNEERTNIIEIDIEMDAPKLAIPQQKIGEGNYEESTVVLNLGHLKICTDMEGKSKLSAEEIGSYECLKVDISDVAVILVDGKFSWPERLSPVIGETSLELENHFSRRGVVIPVLDRCGMESKVQLARRKNVGLTPVRINFEVPQVSCHFSPSRYSRIMGVVKSLTSDTKAKQTIPAVHTEDEEISYAHSAKLLIWEGLGRVSPKWHTHYVMLKRDRLCVYKNRKSSELVRWVRLEESVQIISLGAPQALGKTNAVALVSEGVDAASAVDDTRSVVLNLSNTVEKSKFMHAMELARRKLALLTVGNSFETAAQLVQSSGDAGGATQSAVLIEAVGMVDELLVHVAARPPESEFCPDNSSVTRCVDVPGMVGGEYPLIVLSQKMGRLSATIAQTDLNIDLSVNKFAIEDVLIGTPGAQRFMAQSYDSGGGDADDYARLVYKQQYQHVLSDDVPSMELVLDFSSLRFECHRPTIGALIAMGLDVYDSLAELEETEDKFTESLGQSELSSSLSDASVLNTSLCLDDSERVFFKLSMSMKKLELALNYEDAPNLNVGVAVVENFHYNLDTYQGTFKFTSSLGNVLIFDGTIPEGSPYKQICGLRSDTTGSLISLEFKSHTMGESFVNDRVPNGVEFYSFQANLLSVEIVFFYRWLQEFLSYVFVMLDMTPKRLQTNAAVPSSGNTAAHYGSENPVNLAATLVLLDIELDAPVIHLPSNGEVQECITTDLGHVQVSNTLQWLGSTRQQVLIDNILIKCFDLSCLVHKNSAVGPNMIHDLGEGMNICVYRKLHDPSKSIPVYQVWVTIPTMHCSVSDVEYEFMVNTVLENLREHTRIPPQAYALTLKLFPEAAGMQSSEFVSDSVRGSSQLKRLSSSVSRISSAGSRRDSISKEKRRELIDPSLVSMKISVDIESLQLTLTNEHKSGGDPIPLGRMQVANMQVVQQSLAGGDMHVAVSIPTIKAIDMRPNEANLYPVVLSSCQKVDNKGEDGDRLSPSLIVLDYKYKGDKQFLDVRLQRPTLKLEVGLQHGFILAVMDFAVPSYSLGAKIVKGFGTRDILLTEEPYIATTDIYISPEIRLLADSPGVAQFVLDGNGNRLVLPSDIGPQEMMPFILVGTGATLVLRNMTIINAGSLPSIVQIKAGGQILLEEGDNVHLIEDDDPVSPLRKNRTLRSRLSGSTKPPATKNLVPSFLLDTTITAIGISVNVVDKRRGSEKESSAPSSVHLLTTSLDLYASCKIVDNDYTAEAKLKHVLVESMASLTSPKSDEDQSGNNSKMLNRILEPCDIALKYSANETSTALEASLSQAVINVTPDLLDVLSGIQTLIVDPLIVPGANQPLAKVSAYNLIWSSQTFMDSMNLEDVIKGRSVFTKDQGYISFWRPRPPPGYGILGDVVTCGQKRCNEQVCTVALNSGLAANPVGFEKVWEIDSGVTLWLPVPPESYAAVGCMTTLDDKPPSTTSCLCLHVLTLVETSVAECVWRQPPASIWCIENAARTFTVSDNASDRPKGSQFDIRSPIGIAPQGLSSISRSTKNTLAQQCHNKFNETRRNLIKDRSMRRLVLTTVEFKKIWVDKAARSGTGAGFWRPVPPPGYAIIGDCLEASGLNPPSAATVIFDSNANDYRGSRLLERPKGYSIMWQDTVGKKEKRLNIYRPIPETGYVAMGYVAVVGPHPPSLELVRCVNMEAVAQVKQAPGSPSVLLKKHKQPIHGWIVDKASSSFVCSSTVDTPPQGDMWKLNLADGDSKRYSSQENKEQRIEVKLHSGPVSIQVKDAKLIPIVEIEMHSPSVIATTCGEVTKSHFSLDVSLWSYNSMLKAWEPMLESTQLVMHYDHNSSGKEAIGVSPGSQLRIASCGETVSLTLAYTALDNIMKHYIDFNAQRELDDVLILSTSIDASTMDVVLTNLLGCQAFLLNDHGTVQKTIQLEPNSTQKVQQPLPPPPARYNQSTKCVPGKQSLLIGLLNLQFQMDNIQDTQNFTAVCCTISSQEASCLRTCVYYISQDGYTDINEQFVLDGDSEENHMNLKISILETTLSAAGEEIASGIISFDKLIQGQDTEKFREARVSLVNDVDKEIGFLMINAACKSYKGSLVQKHSSNGHRGRRAIKLREFDSWVEVPSTGVQLPKSTKPIASLEFDTSSLAIPVKVGTGAVLESGYRGGRQEAILRSLFTLVNSTSSTLELRLIDPREVLDSSGSLRSASGSARLADLIVFEEEVYENQRISPINGFSHKNLLPTDRKHFSLKSTGHNNSDDFPDIKLSAGWEWIGPWEVEIKGHVDSAGWCYAADFKLMKYPPKKGAGKKGIMDMTRRRRWVRKRRQKPEQSIETADFQGDTLCLGTVPPGCSYPLPMLWNQDGWQLQVRPIFGERALHHWCLLVSDGEGDGLDLSNLNQGCRRLASCHMKKSQAPHTIPEQMMCSSKFWFTFIVEGKFLPMPVGMEPLMDWTVTIQPPLTLHNVLPFPGQYMVWEEPELDSPLQIRDQGRIGAGEMASIHGADMRSTVALSFYPEDCEFNESMPVTISKGHSEHAAGVTGKQKLPASFRVSKNGNITRVMLERELDVGASLYEEKLDPGAAVAMGYPLEVRIYVPLWVVNITQMPVNVGIVSLQSPTEEIDPEDADNNTDVKCVSTNPHREGSFRAFTMALVQSHGTEIFSYPLESSTGHGAKLQVLGSGWSPPISLQSGSIKKGDEAQEGSSKDRAVLQQLQPDVDSTQRMLIWAQIPEIDQVFPIVAHLDLSGFIRTRVLVLEPHILVSNQAGIDIELRQPPITVQGTSEQTKAQKIPADSSCSPLQWGLGPYSQMILAQARALGSDWSTEFGVHYPHVGDLDVGLNNFPVSALNYLASPMEVENGRNESRRCMACLKISVSMLSPGCLHVLFLSVGGLPPYVIENRTMQPVQFRQPGSEDVWNLLPPLSAQGWVLPNLQSAPQYVEIQDAVHPERTSSKLLPLHNDPGHLQSSDGRWENSGDAFNRQISLGGGLQQGVLEVVDMEDRLHAHTTDSRLSSFIFESAIETWGYGKIIRIHQKPTSSENTSCALTDDEGPSPFKFDLVIQSLSISLVDQCPQELLLLTLDDLGVEVNTGIGSKGRFNCFKVRLKNMQLDNQLPVSQYPVVLAPWNANSRTPLVDQAPVLDLSVVREAGTRQGHHKYPSITSTFGDMLLFVDETVIWRVKSMLDLMSSSAPTNTAAKGGSSDVGLEIGIFQLDGIKTKISVCTDPTSRPRFSHSLSLGLEFANIEDVGVQIKGYEAEKMTILRSVLLKQLEAHLKNQITSIILNLLDYYLSVGGVSQVLSGVGKMIRTAVDDPKQVGGKNPGRVDTLQDGLLEGGSALGKGFIKGITGVLEKPIKGASKEGVEGFFKGVGKGIAGVALTPLGGIFEAASKVTEGLDAITSRSHRILRRRRLPLCIRGDHILRPYNRIEAQGHALLHTTLYSGGQNVNDAYEGHMILGVERMLMWTSNRLVLMKGTGLIEWETRLSEGAAAGQTPNIKPAWSIQWDNLLAVNHEHSGQKDPPGVVVVHAKARSPHFNNQFSQVLKMDPKRCTVESVRDLLWDLMEQHSCIEPQSLENSPAGNQHFDELPSQIACADFELVWKPHGNFNFSIWQPKGPPGYISLGHVVGVSNPPNSVPVFLDDSHLFSSGAPPRLAKPSRFVLIYRDTNPRSGKLTIWHPCPPPGYMALGSLVVHDICRPSVNSVRCIREDLCVCTRYEDHSVWRGQSSDVDDLHCSFWTKQGDHIGFFQACQGLRGPSRRDAYIPMRVFPPAEGYL